MKETIRKQYQKKINQLIDLDKIKRPREGWIRTWRKALGMSSTQLAALLGLGKAQVTQMERMETQDRITLKQLRRVAEAIDAELIYAFVPRHSLEQTLHSRAQFKARRLVEKANVQMKLEAQQLSEEELENQIDMETQRLLMSMPRDLWND